MLCNTANNVLRYTKQKQDKAQVSVVIRIQIGRGLSLCHFVVKIEQGLTSTYMESGQTGQQLWNTWFI